MTLLVRPSPLPATCCLGFSSLGSLSQNSLQRGLGTLCVVGNPQPGYSLSLQTFPSTPDWDASGDNNSNSRRKVLFQGRHELGKRFIWLFLLNLHHLS